MSYLNKLAYQLFGKNIKKHENRYYSVQEHLRQSRMPMQYDIYVARARLISVCVGICGALLGSVLASILISINAVPAGIFTYVPGIWYETIFSHKNSVFFLVLTVLSGCLFSLSSYKLILYYPHYLATLRKTKIDLMLPHIVTLMYALSKSGMNLIQIFDKVSKLTDVYSEAAEEVMLIVKYMDNTGSDIMTSMSIVGQRTPSHNFRDFIENLLAIADAGGDLSDYLASKSSQFQKEATQQQRIYLETLGIIAESYITIFVAGPLFLIIIIVVMGLMSGAYMSILQLLIYVFLPLGSVGFIVLLSVIAVKFEDMDVKTIVRTLSEYDDVHLQEPSKYDNFFIKWLNMSKKERMVMEYIRNPLKTYNETPGQVLKITIPLAVVFVLFFFNTNYPFEGFDAAVRIMDDYLVFGMLIAVVPFSLFHEHKIRRYNEIDDKIPEFLSGLASINKTGLTLTQAIEIITESNLGVLTSEVKKMWRDIKWGADINEAFIHFQQRVKTGAIVRMVTLITNASQSSGNVQDVLFIASKDANVSKSLKQERKFNMLIYLMIIYVAFFVFLFIVYTFTVSFFPVIATNIGTNGELNPMQTSGFMQAFDVEKYTMLFFHAAIIQGVVSGLVSGEMCEGNMLSGLKHVIIMVSISYVIFTVLI